MRSDGSLERDPYFTEPGTTRRPSWRELKCILYHFHLLDSSGTGKLLMQEETRAVRGSSGPFSHQFNHE